MYLRLFLWDGKLLWGSFDHGLGQRSRLVAVLIEISAGLFSHELEQDANFSDHYKNQRVYTEQKCPHSRQKMLISDCIRIAFHEVIDICHNKSRFILFSEQMRALYLQQMGSHWLIGIPGQLNNRPLSTANRACNSAWNHKQKSHYLLSGYKILISIHVKLIVSVIFTLILVFFLHPFPNMGLSLQFGSKPVDQLTSLTSFDNLLHRETAVGQIEIAMDEHAFNN